jgi:hypothetical protein
LVPKSSAPVYADLVAAFRALDFDVALSSVFSVGPVDDLGEYAGNPGSTEFVTCADLENTTAVPASQLFSDPVFF